MTTTLSAPEPDLNTIDAACDYIVAAIGKDLAEPTMMAAARVRLMRAFPGVPVVLLCERLAASALHAGLW